MSVRSGQPGDRPAHDQVAELVATVEAAFSEHRAGYERPERGDGLNWLQCADCGVEWAEDDDGKHVAGSLICANPEVTDALRSLARLAADNERLSRDLESVREWFNTEPWKGEPDGSSHGCGPYTPRERSLGYGTHRDPRFLPVALAGGPPGRPAEDYGFYVRVPDGRTLGPYTKDDADAISEYAQGEVVGPPGREQQGTGRKGGQQ